MVTSCAVHSDRKEKLKKELTAILQSDQELRELFAPNLTTERKAEILGKYNISYEEFTTKQWKITEENDSINLLKVEKIIRKYGYPGKALVGEKESTAVWYCDSTFETAGNRKIFSANGKSKQSR